MTTNEKIARIRQLMARDQVQAVIIPSGDPHMSEYFSEHWKTRRFVSGFTGSVGTYVITENASGLSGGWSILCAGRKTDCRQ